MITMVKGSTVNEYRGLSTDTKPTDVPNGSTYYEFDTVKLFVFDEDTGTWLEQ